MTEIEPASSDNQKILLEKAMSVVERIPPPVAAAGGSADENAWKNCWNWNLTDAAFGQLVLDIKEGRVNAEMKSQGFNYAYRRQTPAPNAAPTGIENGLEPPPHLYRATSTAPGSAPITKPGTPAPAAKPANSTKANSKVTSPVVPKANIPAATAPPGDAKANGQSVIDKEAAKREKRKQKEKEKKAEKAAERAAHGDPTKKDTKSNGTDAGENENTEEVTGGLVSPDGESGGALTPLSRRGSRNPWTLFVKHLPVPVTEDEIKDFFGDAKSGVSILLLCLLYCLAEPYSQIVYVKIPYATQGTNRLQKHFAYVEFGDEEAMKAGLASKGDVCDRNHCSIPH